jgi:hypothetical protein
MNRFTIIVMTDSREDSDAVVHAVSALGRDKDAEQEAAIAQMAGEREYAVQAAMLREREELRRRVHVLKLGPVTIDGGETRTVTAESRFPFSAACLKISGETAHHFVISDLRFVAPGDLGGHGLPYDFRASGAPIPAVTFSDDAALSLALDVECRAASIAVTNTSKKKHIFRAQIVGFRRD